MKKILSISVSAALLMVTTYVSAADNYIVIQRGSTTLSDSSPTLVRTFTLPALVNLSSSIANSAVLQFVAVGSEFNFNEIYINPPTEVCTDNDTDANQAKSIGFINDYDDTQAKFDAFTNHIAFSSALLQPGANKIMFCVRDATGEIDSANIDNVTIKSVVLHYKTL
ncbi:MAG: hypothetical protein LZF61_04365 [Nitrosomonas sp.]|nr:MAG: hypothetical protein LZF61_04365 [Nitrosomonas sp.]